MKIIKGKLIFIMLFLTLLNPQHGGYLYGLFCCLSAVVCFFSIAFLKSDTVVALTSYALGDAIKHFG